MNAATTSSDPLEDENEPPSSTPRGVGDREAASPLVVLVGRPNSGKSSLFNAVTGGRAHVGNFPGITVDVLEGEAKLPGGRAVTLADLPGLYSMEAIVDQDTDEGVARRFVDRMREMGRPMVIVHVVDSTNLPLHLRLTRELLRLGLPLMVAASQSDLLERSGRSIDAEAFERELGVPMVVVSARSSAARARVLATVESTLDRGLAPDESASFDPAELAGRIVTHASHGLSPSARTHTENLDSALLHPILGPILFVGLMAALFAAVFMVADPATAAIDGVVGWTRLRIEALLGDGMLSSFISNGLLGGAGTVLAFLPQIVVLTVAMELLEASGYLARGAFLVDRFLRVMGLSGRSFLPLLMGHACAIPAIAATRIVRDPKERLTAILVLPLMTCSARIPTYALIVSTFFFHASLFAKAAIFVVLYFGGLASGLVASLILRRTVVRGKTLPLVLEMPGYRMPEARLVARQALRAGTRFIRDVGTTIVLASAVLWAVLTIPSPIHVESASPPSVTESADHPPIERSVAAAVGHAMSPLTKPLGFDWRINVGLIGSFGARELMVGTLGVIFGIEDADRDASPLSDRMRAAKNAAGEPTYPARTGLALLAFFVVACQCMSTLAAIRRETKSWRWPAFVLGYTYAAAYVLALAVHEIAKLAGL